jgi:hypothetical protein
MIPNASVSLPLVQQTHAWPATAQSLVVSTFSTFLGDMRHSTWSKPEIWYKGNQAHQDSMVFKSRLEYFDRPNDVYQISQ